LRWPLRPLSITLEQLDTFNIDLMNSETRIGDHIGKQLAQRLPTLSPRVGNNVRGQSSAEILLEAQGDCVF
jgi:hypothetical protein